MYGQLHPSADLFAELNRFQAMMNQALGLHERSSIRGQPASAFPVLNVGTTPESIEVMAMAPGLDPATLDLSVDRGLLVIAGERTSPLPKQAEGTSVYAQERFSGPFRRVVALPEDADPARVEANYRDGILRITVAKRESSRPRRIAVS